MSFKDIIKNNIFENASTMQVNGLTIVVTMFFCVIFSVYVYCVYKFLRKGMFYDANFNICMAAVVFVVAGLVLAMQVNFAVSLGMVGSLSIVRFRTAIKDPLDLLFVFWAISNGIMIGVGTYTLCIAVSLMITVVITFFQMLPIGVTPYLIVVHGECGVIAKIIELLNSEKMNYKVDSKKVIKGECEMIFEVRCVDDKYLIEKVSNLEGVTYCSSMKHEGTIKF